MFYGRERELQLLEERYASGRFEFIPIYGRRRVGKTTLIKRFIEGKEAIYFSAVRKDIGINLSRLSAAVFGNRGITADLEALLSEIARRSDGRRFVLVIDEYPNLVRGNEWVSDTFQTFIDGLPDGNMLFLILCGSSMNMMEHEVLGSKSPLYGRRTGSLKVRPFDYFQARMMLEGFDEDDRMRIYGMVGGIPLYLQQFDPGMSLEENVKRRFLREDSFFLQEPAMMLMEEFTNPMTYGSVIEAVANGNTRNSEIANYTGIQATNTITLLKNLAALGVVSKIRPVDRPDGRAVRYRLEDPFLRFFYRNISQRYDSLTESETDDAVAEVLKGHEDSMGAVFEGVCAEFLRGRGAVGKWWGTDPVRKSSEEIDVVVSKRVDGILVRTFCECKYTSWKVGMNVLDTLVRRSALVGGTGRSEFILFSKSGFTDEVLARPGLETYTLEDMVRIRAGKES